MSRELIEILVLAAIAAFVVSRLYSVLGRRTGSERPQVPPAQAQRPAPASPEAGPMRPAREAAAPVAPAAPATGGVGDIQRLDPDFDPSRFLSGARAAYEMIVNAFSKGDVDTLRGLLTPRVFSSYESAIRAREAGALGPDLVRLKSAEVLDAHLAGDTARVAVRFEAELAEGAHGVRETRERWTFERDTRSRDPNWFLAAVAQA